MTLQVTFFVQGRIDSRKLVQAVPRLGELVWLESGNYFVVRVAHDFRREHELPGAPQRINIWLRVEDDEIPL